MKVIDSHQHFWDPSRGDYHWMPKDNPILNRKYEVKDLSEASGSIDLHKTILVQAAATNAETEYMLHIAESSDLVCGVVGWVNFEDKNQLNQLRIFSKHPKFIGVRPMIQDIPDENWVLNKNFDIFFKSIIDLDLSFDALGFPIHLENFYIIASKYPKLRFVIDHLMKPKIYNNNQEDFISGIGNTPLIKLRAASEITGCNIYGKAEFLNPGGSVKDRAALALIKDAQQKKLISNHHRIRECL